MFALNQEYDLTLLWMGFYPAGTLDESQELGEHVNRYYRIINQQDGKY